MCHLHGGQKMGLKPFQKWQTLKTQGNSIIFGGCWAYKSGLKILIPASEVPFFSTRLWALLPKVAIMGYKNRTLGARKF